MKRRDFLKSATLGTGALAVGSVNTAFAAEKTEKVNTPLGVKGYVKEPARQIPLVDSADVLVVGGGPAGFAAALAARREGLDVLLLERQYFLGGLFTGCGVTPIIDMFSPTVDGKVQAVRGICQELCDRVDAAHMLNFERVIPKVDVEAAKYFMEAMLQEEGARILYGVQASQVIMSGDSISTVIIEGKSGRVAINAKFVIDCTGDGDILEWAGEDFTVYKDDIGAMWRVGNASKSKYGNPTAVAGVNTMHTTGEKSQDGLDMYNLSRIQISLRKMMWENAEMQRKQEGCEDLFLLDTPSVVGVRVTRVLNSVRNVSLEGAVTGKSYDDVIGYAGADSTLSFNGAKYKSVERKIWQIPYSAITPKRVKNLLVAGRCFGYERGLTYDSREVGTCFMTGQAAGTAASIAVNSRCSSQDVDVKRLQSILRREGAILEA